jgi:hypothetical protein
LAFGLFSQHVNIGDIGDLSSLFTSYTVICEESSTSHAFISQVIWSEEKAFSMDTRRDILRNNGKFRAHKDMPEIKAFTS